MSAPSRRPEIRRRRTRAEKIAKLRKRLAAASASTDKDLITAKLHRVGLVSPGKPLFKSAERESPAVAPDCRGLLGLDGRDARPHTDTLKFHRYESRRALPHV